MKVVLWTWRHCGLWCIEGSVVQPRKGREGGREGFWFDFHVDVGFRKMSGSCGMNHTCVGSKWFIRWALDCRSLMC